MENDMDLMKTTLLPRLTRGNYAEFEEAFRGLCLKKWEAGKSIINDVPLDIKIPQCDEIKRDVNGLAIIDRNGVGIPLYTEDARGDNHFYKALGY